MVTKVRLLIQALCVASLILVAPFADASTAASKSHAREYSLPSDGWKTGDGTFQVAFGGPFHAKLTSTGACAWIGAAHPTGGENVLWPAHYMVRFHPTELVDPTGKVVAREGTYVLSSGAVVSKSDFPHQTRCIGHVNTVAALEDPQFGASATRQPG